ncbi:unnamed protein product [Cuscuta epithymum]|uniref:Cytochrome P450 n=1 Tax=Cuscuta epithymum TaxID=186058 RepID=A0AAV0EN91_9ASTE|nr:unnamed protein product [Cuscuta epithymum]
MELNYFSSSSSNIPFIIIFLSLSTIAFSFLLSTIGKLINKKPLPPGPWKLPIIGSLHHLIGELPHRSLTRLSRKYGPLMHLQLGEVPAIVVSSPEMAKAVTKTHDLAFSNRPRLMALDLVFYKCTDIAFAPYGDYWREMRRICILELLTAKMVKSFGSIRQDELRKLVSSVTVSSSLSSSLSVVNVMKKVMWFNSSMTCRAAFGRIKLSSRDKEKLIAKVTEVLSYAGGFDVADLFPSRKWIPYVCGSRSRLLTLHRGLDKIYESMIEEHEENTTCRSNEEEEEDIVDVLLRVGQVGEHRLTRDNIKAVINDLFSAGSETTATTATWAMSELMRNRCVMDKAQEEVRSTINGGKTTAATSFDDDEVEKLTYLKLVIRETLRLHPPIPLLLPRESSEEIVIGGFTIPPKTRAIVNAWAIGRDPEVWEDPEAFWPERFMNNNSSAAAVEADVHGNHYELLPFGAGRRVCPGVRFGLANVTHSLAALLYHFDWELPPGVTTENFDMSETMGLKATRKKDLCLVARPYTHSSLQHLIE